MTRRILVLESDGPQAEELSGFLSAKGYAVATRSTAREGYDALERRRFDALILSARLPDSDGFEVCRQVRTRSGIAILMLTHEGQAIERIIGLEIGADDCMSKPIGMQELAARLGTVMRRRKIPDGAPEAPLEFGRLRIERRERIVRLDGVKRPLTPQQYALLLVLAENAGRVLSRAELRDALNGSELAAFDRSIDVQVCRLRSLIEDDPQSPCRLVTIRGVGYLFERGQDPPSSAA